MEHIFILDPDIVKRRTAQNLVEAGVLHESEVNHYLNYLNTLDPKDVIATLLESHTLRDESTNHKSYYPIEIERLSRN